LVIFIIDVVVIFGCAISVSKQLISWLPFTFKLYTDLMLSMINLNQLMQMSLAIYITFSCTTILTMMLY
jgi:hypothetical protein